MTEDSDLKVTGGRPEVDVLTTADPPCAGCPSTRYHDAVAHISTAVALITSEFGGERIGALSAGVVPVSDEPPMVLVAIDREAPLGRTIDRSGDLVVDLLSVAQRDLVVDPSGRPNDPIRVAGLLKGFDFDGSVARLECKVTERMTSSSNLIFVALVCAAKSAGGTPLVSFRGAIDALGS